MIKGHGDDIFSYPGIKHNFSSNIVCRKDLDALYEHLNNCMPLICSYPEPDAESLTSFWAYHLGVLADNLCVTNGATEAIYLIAQVFRESKSTILVPTFSEYADALTLFPPQSEESSIWLCNPNNPTGEVFSIDDIYEMAQAHNLVIIDQSYEDYTDAPMLSAREAVEMGKVIQLHSLTKAYGVPGLRIGYIAAAPRLAKRIRQFLRPWAVNALAIEAGKYLLQHGTKLKPDLKETQRLAQRLRTTCAVTVDESHTNFMLCEIHPYTAAELKDYLTVEHGMLIRDASNFEGLTLHHFRIAAQSSAENDALVEAIKTFIEKKQHE